MGVGIPNGVAKKLTGEKLQRALKHEIAWHEEEVKKLAKKLEEAEKTYEARVTGKNVIILNERLR